MDVSGLSDQPVREIMTVEVLGIVPSAPLEVALRMMVEARVHHLPVVDRRGCLGLLYEADVLWRLWSTSDGRRPGCAAVMRRPAPCVEMSATVRAAVRRMRHAGSDAVLVVDGGQVAGIVTATNLIRLLATG